MRADPPVARGFRSREPSSPISRNTYGARIASTVSVRPPKARSDRAPTGAHREFTHRFEVHGHYKHYGPDTMLFKATQRDRPHKIVHHGPRGPVVRVRTPDFVKGPAHRPLVPKVRTYTNRGR